MYDDFAILDKEKFDIVNREYQKQKSCKILSVKKLQPEETESLMQKIEYLQKLLQKLKANTKNSDTLLVLDGIIQDVQNQQDKINVLLGGAMAMGETEPETVIFCNNLKLAIQTTGEIVKQLIEVKDSEQTAGEIKPDYTDIILSFIDINNKLVSLFGECRYRVFRQRKIF